MKCICGLSHHLDFFMFVNRFVAISRLIVGSKNILLLVIVNIPVTDLDSAILLFYLLFIFQKLVVLV